MHTIAYVGTLCQNFVALFVTLLSFICASTDKGFHCTKTPTLHMIVQLDFGPSASQNNALGLIAKPDAKARVQNHAQAH